MIYIFNEHTCEIQCVSDTIPEHEFYCISDTKYNLDLNRVIVGYVDSNHKLLRCTVIAKPLNVLASRIDEMITLEESLQYSNLELNIRVCMIEMGLDL